MQKAREELLLAVDILTQLKGAPSDRSDRAAVRLLQVVEGYLSRLDALQDPESGSAI
jgi:hypothetical protein